MNKHVYGLIKGQGPQSNIYSFVDVTATQQRTPADFVLICHCTHKRN